METQPPLEGIFSAQWNPFDPSGRIDRSSLESHIDFERRSGVRGILALGSTAGFPFLSPAERIEALGTLARLARGMTLIANVTDIRPKVAIEVGKAAQEFGFDAIALMPPVFYPVSQSDMLAYFLHVAGAVDLPVLLYNFPELTGKKIELETVAAFATRARMLGIKQSGAEFEYHVPLIRLAQEKGFVVATGSDLRLPEAFALGAKACIGGLVNIVPEFMVRLFDSRGRPLDTDSQLAFDRLRVVGSLIDQLTFPLNVAAGMEARGLVAGSQKTVVSDTTAAAYVRVVSELRARFAEWDLKPPMKVANASTRKAPSPSAP